MSETRNFWLNAEIDQPNGVKQVLAGGPAAKDGGFKLTITMLDGSDLRIYGGAWPDGDTYMSIVGPKGGTVKNYVTKRPKVRRSA